MAQIEVGLRPVVGDVDLAVLIGRHRARIDVEIRIELANPHAITACLQQRRKARRHQTLAERGDHAAGNENKPRHGVYRSEEHTSELQSLMRISYAVFCLKKKITSETKRKKE